MNFKKRLFNFMGLFMDWKLETDPLFLHQGAALQRFQEDHLDKISWDF